MPARYLSLVPGGRLSADWSRFQSNGSRGDSDDNAPAQTLNGLYKLKVIHCCAPWKTKELLEIATLEWVSCFNYHRLLEPIGYIPHAEAEARYYRQLAEKTKTRFYFN